MWIFVFLIAFAYVPICMSLICRKLGYPMIFGFLTIIPWGGSLIAVLLLWYAAFAPWPRWRDAGLE